MSRLRWRGSTRTSVLRVSMKRATADCGSTPPIAWTARRPTCWARGGRRARAAADRSTSACRLGACLPEVVARTFRELGCRHRQIAFDPEHCALPAGKPASAILFGYARHLRERYPENLLAGPIERDSELLILGRAQDVGVGAAQLLERGRVRVLGLRIHRVAAVEGKRVRAGQGIPEVCDADRGLGVPCVPQGVRDLAIDPRVAAGWLEAREGGRDRVPKRYPFRQAAGNQFCGNLFSIQDGQLSRIAQ